jgi:hypothetical protein
MAEAKLEHARLPTFVRRIFVRILGDTRRRVPHSAIWRFFYSVDAQRRRAALFIFSGGVGRYGMSCARHYPTLWAQLHTTQDAYCFRLPNEGSGVRAISSDSSTRLAISFGETHSALPAIRSKCMCAYVHTLPARTGDPIHFGPSRRDPFCPACTLCQLCLPPSN